MPHYHIVEATQAIKPVLGEYFVEPEKSGPIPFHLMKRFFQGAKVRTIAAMEMRLAGGVRLRSVQVVDQCEVVDLNGGLIVPPECIA